MRFFKTVLFLFLLISISFSYNSQCTLGSFGTSTITSTATQDTIIVACNDSAILSVAGSGFGSVAFQEDFNSGQPIGWNFSQTVTIANNTCGVPSLDGTDFMWMGGQSPSPRIMETVDLDVSNGGDVCFEMRYAIQSQPSPCEGPDQTNEGVYLDYSINGGATWVNINYWAPTNNGAASSPLTQWAQFCEQIPAAAQTTATRFRWNQASATSAGYDHWGLDNIQITQSAPSFNITWMHDNYSYGMGNYTGNNPNAVYPTGDSTYYVMMTDSVDTCYSSIHVIVSFPQIDTILTLDPFCGGINGTIDISASGGTPSYEFSIDGGTTFQASQNFTQLDTNVYNVILLDQNFCSDTGLVTLTGVDSLKIVNLNSTHTSCGLDNGLIDFQSIGGSPSYVFSLIDVSAPTNVITDSLSNFPNLIPGTYMVIVTDSLLCSDSSVVIIDPSTGPVIDSIVTYKENCGFMDGQLITYVSSGITPYTIEINDSVNFSTSNNTGDFTGLNSGLYYVIVTDAVGCQNINGSVVDSVPPPYALLPDTNVCNLSFQINGVVTETGSDWSSDSPNISFNSSSSPNPTISATSPGIYTIGFSDTLCNFRGSFLLAFVSDPYTDVNDTAVCIGQTYPLPALESSQNTSYMWNTGATGAVLDVDQPGLYVVTASNICGDFSDSAFVDFYLCDLKVPNVFTPNDDGSNDNFQLLFESGISSLNCIITNRWGNVIRTFNEASFSWDGTNENGNDVQDGVYFYKIDAITDGGNEVSKHGFVHLVRD